MIRVSVSGGHDYNVMPKVLLEPQKEDDNNGQNEEDKETIKLAQAPPHLRREGKLPKINFGRSILVRMKSHVLVSSVEYIPQRKRNLCRILKASWCGHIKKCQPWNHLSLHTAYQ